MSLIPEMPLAAVLDVVRVAVMVLFLFSALLMTLVILMQEGKGGGLAGAFGGAGAETFGVKAGTVNRFTAWLAAGFLGLALLHAGMSAASIPTATTGGSRPDIEGLAPGTDTPEEGGQPAQPGAPVDDKPEGDDGEPAEGAAPDEGDAGDGSGDAGDGSDEPGGSSGDGN